MCIRDSGTTSPGSGTASRRGSTGTCSGPKISASSSAVSKELRPMPELTYTADEMMTIQAARMIRNGVTLFVGIGLPSAAANLARLTHAPDTVLIYESGTIGAKPTVLPLSIGDGELSETADAVVSIP